MTESLESDDCILRSSGRPYVDLPMTSSPFLGRAPETAALDDLLAGVAERGAALAIRGEAGIGKSALLAEASRRAIQRGMSILKACGVESEANLPFAGLHQLLRPVLGAALELPAPQRDALLAAFGMTDAAAPALFLIALAALNLLCEISSAKPLLLIAEDAHWLDRATCDVLAFIARRLDSEPIVLLIAIRDGFETPLDGAGLAELRLAPLDDRAASALLDAHAADLGASTRARLLETAAGNPLALVELPAALASEPVSDGTVLPPILPLSTRLERTFAARVSDLPAPTRTLLLVAAVDDAGLLAEILAATSELIADAPAIEHIGPAVRARLIEVDDTHLQFRHPLMRSAIHQAATMAERHAAHAALGKVLTAQPDRRAWHRAASIVGYDEDAAADLEAAAARAQHRGGSLVAVAALERAAGLSADPELRARRSLAAAELALYFGRVDVMHRILERAGTLEVPALERRRVVWMRALALYLHDTALGIAKVRALLDILDDVAADDMEHVLNAIMLAAVRCWWIDPGEEARARLVAAIERLPGIERDPRLVAVRAFLAPVERCAQVRDALVRAELPSRDPAGSNRTFGLAAVAIGDFEQAHRYLSVAVTSLRAEGRLGLLARGLVMQAWTATLLVNCSVAAPAAEEGERLAAEAGEPLFAAGAQVAKAMLAALRGDESEVEELVTKAERVALPIRASAVLAFAQMARGLASLGAGRHTEAYEQIRRTFDPTDPAYHPFMRCWAIGDLAEAAAHSEHRDDARALLKELEPLAVQTPSPWFHAAMLYARPVLADEDDAEKLFGSALQADLSKMPFTRARLQLAHGAWLRRRRRVGESRAPIRSARDAFDALRVPPWAERARQELRASGETSRRRTPEARDLLSPQELQIAQLAADGLSNREIGQRLYLSHRTIGSHLYRLFPKLGITTRSQLRGALEGVAAPVA